MKRSPPNSECHAFIVVLSVDMPSVVMLNVSMPSVVRLNVVAQEARFKLWALKLLSLAYTIKLIKIVI